MSPRADVEALLEARGRQQRGLLDEADKYVGALRERMPVRAAVVVGSVARGDFNLWSDTDLVVVVDEELPVRPYDRLMYAEEGRPVGTQPILWTPAEFADALAKGNPLALEAVGEGVVLHGETWLDQMARH